MQRIRDSITSQPKIEHIFHTTSSQSSGIILVEGPEKVYEQDIGR